jgi:hypothetical protein
MILKNITDPRFGFDLGPLDSFTYCEVFSVGCTSLRVGT